MSIENVKWEIASILKNHGKSSSNIKKLYIEYYDEDSHSTKKFVSYDEIPSSLEYDSSYGRQYVFGMILIDNGDWMERREYDGSEWWEYRKPIDVEFMEDLISGKKSL